MSFWANFGVSMATSIDKLLSENPSLEQVLDDDDCIQEVRSQNEKLIELFFFLSFPTSSFFEHIFNLSLCFTSISY